MKNIPNILSVLRMIMIGVFIYFFQQENYLAALCVYLLAVLTDLLDGYLARRNNWVTNLGKVLDPLADKLMLLTALFCFCEKGWLPPWLVIIVAAKEFVMIVGGALLWKKKVVVYADWFGKAATGFFNMGVTATLLKNFWPWIRFWNIVLLCIAMILAIIALVHYAKKNVYPQIQNAKADKRV